MRKEGGACISHIKTTTIDNSIRVNDNGLFFTRVPPLISEWFHSIYIYIYTLVAETTPFVNDFLLPRGGAT